MPDKQYLSILFLIESIRSSTILFEFLFDWLSLISKR